MAESNGGFDVDDTNCREFSEVERNSEAGAESDVQSNERGGGEESGAIGLGESNDDALMNVNVEGLNNCEETSRSAIMTSTSRDENGDTPDVGALEHGGDDNNEEWKISDASKQVESSVVGINANEEGDLEVVRSRAESFPESITPIAAKCKSLRNKKQDDFVKRGARARTLLTTALRAVADGFASKAALCSDVAGEKKVESESIRSNGRKSGGVGNDDDSPRKTWVSRSDYAHIQDLAQERAQECMALKRKLDASESQIEFLQNENAASNLMNSQFKAKIDRTIEALQIAGTNAANARAEADASNARVESLSGQLNELQSVIEETKRGMEVVRREHDEVSRAARSVEGRLIQVEGELTRASRAKKGAINEREFLKSRAEEAERLARQLQDEVEDYQDEVRMLKKDLLEVEEMEKLRAERINRIESEFQEARSGLLEATTAAAEAESTVTSLRGVIDELRRRNESLHEQMSKSRENVSKDRAKQNEALILAEREAQKWKMKCEEADEEARKLKMDKTSTEKQVDHLKSRVANMERRLNDSSKQFTRTETIPSASSASNLGFINAFGDNDSSLVMPNEHKKRKYITELPRRESSKSAPTSSSRQLTYSYPKENNTGANQQQQPQRPESIWGQPKRKIARTNKCCICLKEGGMILSCQCNNVNCDKRAHAICIGKARNNRDSKRTILCGSESN